MFEVGARFGIDPARQPRRDREATEYRDGPNACGQWVVPK